MLLGVTHIGSLRQRVDKGFALVPADAVPPTRGGVTLRRGNTPGLWYAMTPLRWLGAGEARTEWSNDLAVALRAAASGGAHVLPTAVTVAPPGGGQRVATALGDDLHVLEVASSIEQEVLCNLLREYVPLLVAISGRGSAAGQGGSSRLAGSREHVATRYLVSTSDQHLSRVMAELRSVDGVAQFDRMDVYPGAEPDGTLTVTVRCIDASASLATTRAHALLLAAFALRARRLVREGRRLGHLPQRRLEENRARAVAHGLRSRLIHDDGPAGAAGRDARRTEQTSARELLRTLFADTLAVEFDNLRATPEELCPLLLPLESERLGPAGFTSDDELLRAWSAAQPTQFATVAGRILLDGQPGGPCLVEARRVAPGRTGLLLDEWAGIIAARGGSVPSRPAGAQGGRGRDQRGRDQGSDGHGRGQPRGSGRQGRSRGPRGGGQRGERSS